MRDIPGRGLGNVDTGRSPGLVPQIVDRQALAGVGHAAVSKRMASTARWENPRLELRAPARENPRRVAAVFAAGLHRSSCALTGFDFGAQPAAPVQAEPPAANRGQRGSGEGTPVWPQASQAAIVCQAKRRPTCSALVALDESRGINNGQPSLWAFLIDQLDIAAGENVLHLGCGTGYYTAIMAELAGPTGKITAIEIDAGLAEKARAALMPWPQITVSNADGANISFEPVDLIVASAGATHPLSSWLDALKPGGRLLFPMTATRRGGMLLVTREAEDGFAARFLCQVGFIDFRGARNPDISRRLAAALGRDWGRAVRSLRRDHHAQVETCWLHERGLVSLARLPAVAGSSRPRQ